MPYDEALARRIERQLAGTPGISQRRMFGGICYMLNGNMCAGIVGSELMLRLGAAGVADALAEPHTRPMDFTGRVMKNMVYVEPAGFATDEQLAAWLDRALRFASSLPLK
jgi:TfoX/Sxy family transcriptional regulator of competence genes